MTDREREALEEEFKAIRERKIAEAWADKKYSRLGTSAYWNKAVDGFMNGRASAREEIDRLKRLLDRAEEALVIYANPARYIENYRKQLDGGEKAREVLAAIREGRK